MAAGKILIIEDNKDLLKLLAQLIRDQGYEVSTAVDGQEGLEKVQTEEPDLVIADLAIPKMTGNVVVRILKQSPRFVRLPIIMLSAFVSPDMQFNVEVPADCYMSKPFNEEALLHKIEELIAKSGREKAVV